MFSLELKNIFTTRMEKKSFPAERGWMKGIREGEIHYSSSCCSFQLDSWVLSLVLRHQKHLPISTDSHFSLSLIEANFPLFASSLVPMKRLLDGNVHICREYFLGLHDIKNILISRWCEWITAKGEGKCSNNIYFANTRKFHIRLLHAALKFSSYWMK